MFLSCFDLTIENFETEKIGEFEINSKAVQVSPIVLSKCTQTSFGFGKDMSTQTEDEHKETWIQEHSMTLKTMMTNR